jgi:hypothetical protein
MLGMLTYLRRDKSRETPAEDEAHVGVLEMVSTLHVAAVSVGIFDTTDLESKSCWLQ